MQVSSANAAIDAVGGTTEFARWWGASSDSVSVWRKRGFPAKTFFLMRARLRDEKQLEVDPSAWGMLESVAQ